MRVQGSGEEGTAATRLLCFPWSTANPSRLSRGKQRMSELAEMRERRRERRGTKLGKLKGGGTRNRNGDRLPLRKANPKWRRSGGGRAAAAAAAPPEGGSEGRLVPPHLPLLPLRLLPLRPPPSPTWAKRARPPTRARVYVAQLVARCSHQPPPLAA